MSLTTLAAVKTHLGIAQTSEDAAITQWIRGASSAIREHCGDYLYGMLGAITVGSPTTITCPGHGLETGDVINIAGSGSTPSLDGAQTVTVIDADTFTVPVSTSGVNANAAGLFARTYTDFYSGDGTNGLLLDHGPVRSITNLWLDAGGYFGEPADAFADSTLLTAGTDYVLDRDNNSAGDVSHSALVWRIGGNIWPRPAVRTPGLLALRRGSPIGNIKVQYIAGYTRPVPAVQLACHQFVAQLRGTASNGGPLKREMYDYYRYERDPGLEATAIDSVRQLLKRFKRWEW